MWSLQGQMPCMTWLCCVSLTLRKFCSPLRWAGPQSSRYVQVSPLGELRVMADTACH